jgi:lipopolysaccharide/colanic/teichoic acid biosynthesis glycosyltransferase
VFTSPILLLAVILIKVTSPGPAFYLQKRTGLNGRPFIIYKIRTMHMGAERGKKPRWAKRNDIRITPVGKFLRRYRIDELPQLINVLKNDMSIVGPRPERPYFTFQLMKKVPFYAHRLQAKPGLTGWAQVNLRYTDTEKGAQEKLLYDLFYIHNASFALDSLILLKTFQVVLSGKGAY